MSNASPSTAIFAFASHLAGRWLCGPQTGTPVVETIQTLVVGAGAVGLATARGLARAGHEVLVIDKAADIGTETSSRNSEVIHAGIYYPPGSLKARLCVEGRHMLYEFCREQGVEVRRTGKLIVAVNEAESPKLKALAAVAVTNRVDDLVWMTASDVARIEPEVSCKAALLSPSTGIIDSRGFMLALHGDAEAHGASVILRTGFVASQPGGGRINVTLRGQTGEEMLLACRNIVNSAGHGAHGVAAAIAGIDKASLPPRFLAKGSYCSVSGRSPFRHLIYPVPVPGALGTHVTLDLNGAVRLGPNIEWVTELDYSVSDSIAAQFAGACQGFWPGVRDRELTPSYCGIRPKLHGPGTSFADFMVHGPDQHGVDGLVNLFGIESPGLTSSLAIGRLVCKMLGADGSA